MSSDRQSDRHGHPDGFAEFTEELRLLAEVLLARVEPVLRRTAADGQADLGGCAWCPVCAAAALVRGDHHDVVAALADHGTSMVTVLREALAGVPVEPVMPPEWAEHAAGHHDSHAAWVHNGAGDPVTPDHPAEPSAPADPAVAPSADRAAGTAPQPDHPDTAGRSRLRWGSARTDQSATPRPHRVDEYAAPRQQGAPAGTGMGPHIPADSGTPSGTGLFAAPTEDADHHRDDRPRTTRAPRSRYVDIPVTIRG
ncbi:hypothetical protein [Nocardia sp. NPDC060259]|uniref:hypothetical protein n=1 Tax=Nocardia sp. NPDC060259 TaxID=3347088 RepID=UPI0036528F27